MNFFKKNKRKESAVKMPALNKRVCVMPADSFVGIDSGHRTLYNAGHFFI